MGAVKHLSVLLEGRQIAELVRTRAGVLRLTYDTSARRIASTPLSLSLPPDIASHAGAAVERFLAGLLPENDAALRAIGRRYHVDTTDKLDVLSAVGKDCAGAVQFCTEEEVEATLHREGSLEECSITDIEMRLDEMDTDENASWMMPGEHWSLGGTQQKFALRRRDDKWWMVQGSQATTHIIKPGVRKLRAQAMDEHATMRAAALLGLDVAHTEFASFRSQDAIVITRFDRREASDGSVVRLHQEDLCQGTGNDEKYEEHGGPSAVDVIRLLRDASATPSQARANVDRFVDGLIFNTVAGAPDAHARNYAVMLSGGDVALAPLYDVASGFAYDMPPEKRRETSMSVGGTFFLDEIDSDAWKRFAESADLDEERVLKRVDEMTAGAADAFEKALDEIDDVEGHAVELRHRITRELLARRRATRA
jgi:serine/threonine-protein kinase HipA